MRVNSYSIVLVGENMPVQQIKPTDFTFPDAVVERMRVPVAFDFQAGAFRVQGFPERYQIGATDVDLTEDAVAAIRDNTLELVDLVGRRSISAVGLNLEFHETDLPVAALRSRVMAADAFPASFLGEVRPEFELTTFFAGPDLSRAKLLLKVPESLDRLVLDLNYHFDLQRNPKIHTPQNAIHRFDAVIEQGRALAVKMCETLSEKAAEATS